MATGFTFDTTKDLLKLEVDGVAYEITSKDGAIKRVDAKVPSTSELESVSKSAAAAANDYVAKAPRAEAGVVAEMQQVKNLIANGIKGAPVGTEFDGLKAISKASDDLKSAIAALPKDQVATVADLAKTKALVVEHPEALNLLATDVTSYNKFFVSTVEVDGKILKLVDQKAFDESVKKLRGGLDKLKTLAESGDFDKAKLRAALIEDKELITAAPTELKNLITASNIPGKEAVDFAEVAKEVEDAIKLHGDTAKGLASDIVKLQEKLDVTKYGKGAIEKQLAGKVEDLSKYTAKHPEYKAHMNAEIKTLGEANLKTFEKAKGTKAILSDLGKAAEAGGKKVGNFFMKNAEELEKFATKEGKAVEKIGFWGKLNGKGKAGIIAGAAVLTYGIVAALGKPGKAAEMNQAKANEQEPATGYAKA